MIVLPVLFQNIQQGKLTLGIDPIFSPTALRTEGRTDKVNYRVDSLLKTMEKARHF